MYKVSNAYDKAVKGRSRSIEWYGNIILTDGTIHPFTNANVVQGTGTVYRSCSSQSSIDIGGVYASEFQVSLRLNIDRFKLFDAVIDCYARLNYQQTVSTWEDASDFSWEDMISCKWGDESKTPYFDIPIGVFTVSEVLRAVNSVKITAYDNMLKFDEDLPTMDTVARTPFEWLRWICDACGVELGVTNNFIRSLPNGSRNLTFADVSNDLSTYRDLLSDLAVVLGSVATIDRRGKLILLQYKMTVVDTVDSSFRYTSDFSDYQSYYTGMYASYRAKAIQEYFKNVGSLDDNGLVMDIGYNVFLQIANDTNRNAAVQAIIDNQKNNKYTPFNVTMPFNPAYDIMDILAFTGNQSSEKDIAPITSMTYKINDKMTIQCVGENPKLLTAQSKESKAITGLNDGASLSGTAFVSSDFWIMIDSFPEDTVEIMTETLTTEVKITTTVDNTRTQIVWTGAYELNENATVNVDIHVDDVSIYKVADFQTKGMHTLSVTTGHEINTKGEHTVKVYVTEVIDESSLYKDVSNEYLDGDYNAYIRYANKLLNVSGTATSSSGNGMRIFKIKENTHYKVRMFMQNRFRVGCTASIATGTIVTNCVIHPEDTNGSTNIGEYRELEITSGAGETYLCVSAWSDGAAKSIFETLNSITLYEKFDQKGLEMEKDMSRLTVTGTGWSNTSFDSGGGFTIDGELWNDIALDLDYDFGDDVDWDIIADVEYPDMNWSDVIYTDPDGNIYTDFDGDGIWRNPDGIEYPGNGDMWIPENMLLDISDILNDLAIKDQMLAQYSIPDDVIPTLFGGKVGVESHPTVTGSDRPHTYTPACWYIQRSYNDAQMFLGEPFYHGTASGGSITVYDEAFTTRDGSSKAIYYSGCTTHFTDNYLPSPYSSYPIQYVAWQCVYGSLAKSLIGKNSNTVSSDDIKKGTSDLEYITVNGKKYYKVKK